MDIQRLLVDHQKSLHSKKEDLEFELTKKKQSFEEDLKMQMSILEKKKNDLKCREDQILARELKLKDGNEQLAADTEKLLTFKDELERLRSTINAEEKQFNRAKESIASLRTDVEQKLDDYKTLKDILTKETEDFRQEKNKFDKEREAVDERRAVLAKELKQFNDEKERFQDMEVNIQKGLQELRLKKEMLEEEHIEFAHELESNLQRKFEEKLREMENEFERRGIQKAHELEELRLKKELLEKQQADFAHELESDLQRKFDEKLREMENEFERRDSQKACELEELKLKKEMLEKEHSYFACALESSIKMKFDKKLLEVENEFERRDAQKAQELEVLKLKKEALEKEHADFVIAFENNLQRNFDHKLREMENEFERRAIQNAHEMEELRLKKEMLEKEHADFSSELESDLQRKFDEKLRVMENEFERRDTQKARELEEIRLKKEMLEKQHADFVHELESDLQRKFDEKLRERENECERRKLPKAHELEELRLKKEALGKENAEFAGELEVKLQRKFEEKLQEMENEFEKRDKQKAEDIDTLQKDLANEREFTKEKELVAEKDKMFKHCDFVVTQELRTPNRMDVTGSQLASFAGVMPSLQNCSIGCTIPFETKASEAETGYSPDDKTKPYMVGDASTSQTESEHICSSNDKRDEGDFKTPPPTKHEDEHNTGWRCRPKPIKRAYPVEAAVEDGRCISGTVSEDKRKRENEGATLMVDLVDIDVYEATGAREREQLGSVGNDESDPDKERVLDDASVGGRHKKLRTPTAPSTGEKRYNFRPSTM